MQLSHFFHVCRVYTSHEKPGVNGLLWQLYVFHNAFNRRAHLPAIYALPLTEIPPEFNHEHMRTTIVTAAFACNRKQGVVVSVQPPAAHTPVVNSQLTAPEPGHPWVAPRDFLRCPRWAASHGRTCP